MGGLLSKVLNHHSEPKTVHVAGNIEGDPRSPTEGVHRTPIALGKKPYLETDIDDLTPTLPLRVKLLRKAIDPRSPTVGINRTPIALLQTPTRSQEFESPVSLYSNYQTDVESFACIPSPVDPSVNVSDFEADEFSRDLDSLVNDLVNSFSDSEDSPTETATKLKLVQKSESSSEEKLQTKKMCESLVQEIIDSFKEYEEEIKTKSRPKSVAKKLSLAPARENLKELQPKSTKTRKPLSNITSAGNTPTKFNMRKDEKLVKVEMAGENSPMANVKVRAQWDHDSTIII